MQQSVAIGEIKKRADAINRNLKWLAQEAGVHPATAYRAAEGAELRASTLGKLTRAIEAEERRLLAYLVALHGVPTERPSETAIAPAMVAA